MVCMKDIAAACGVSQGTVSLALSGDPRVKAATRARVLEAAECLGYDPEQNRAAQRMILRRYGKTTLNTMVALLCGEYHHASNYYLLQIQGILDTLNQAQFGVMVVARSIAPGATLPPLPAAFPRGEVDGAIIFETDPALVAQLSRTPGFTDRPMVTTILEHPACSTVTIDTELGGYLATRHLLELGHRHFMNFVAADWGLLFAQRTAGIRRALQEWGLDPDRHTVATPAPFLGDIAPPYHLEMALGYGGHAPHAHVLAQQRLLLEYLAEHREITALLAHNDPQARRIWYLLQQHGLRVPDDYSLVGFDDTDAFLDASGVNQLTTVHAPLREVGQAAAQLLLDRIHNVVVENCTITLPTSLAVRGSTTPPGR